MSKVSGISGGLAETMREFEAQEEEWRKVRLRRKMALKDKLDRQQRTRVKFCAGVENGKYFGEGL